MFKWLKEQLCKWLRKHCPLQGIQATEADGAAAQRLALQECEVMFLDFLGFSEAVENWPPKKLEELIGLLVRIAEGQSTFDMSGHPQADGSYKIKGQANVTTFSDNIVASFPLLVKPDDMPAEIWPVIAGGWEGMVRERMYWIAAGVALAGLDLGLLVRGGLSRGKLYHHGAVVMGEAMIDAYNLERGAGGARVVVSDRIKDDDRLYKDDKDGRRCLDFLTPLMLLADDRHGDAKVWADGRLKMIDDTIADLNAKGRTAHAAKWISFREQLAFIKDTW